MKKKQIVTVVEEYNSINELTEIDRNLVYSAIKISENAYAKYSGFHVGAALLLDDYTIVTGSNQENAAYPSGLCAERVALFYANSNFPDKKVVSLAIAAHINGKLTDYPVPPCGACRQVIMETIDRYGKPMKIIMAGKKSIQIIQDAQQLLPLKFDKNHLSF
ncbi:MAG: cytidine deaminase [Marinilabiliales bacterium]